VGADLVRELSDLPPDLRILALFFLLLLAGGIGTLAVGFFFGLAQRLQRWARGD
jgi:hypothetical protein